MRSSFNDLLSHQAGLEGGSAAALQGLLAKLSPDAMAQMLKGRSFLANRTGALWTEYVQAHQEATEAAEKSDDAGGAAFREGYEKAAADRGRSDKVPARGKTARPAAA